MREQANVKCDANIKQEIAVYLNRVNSYVQSFQTMGDLCRNSSDGNEKKICMHITVNASSNQRRYNDATSTDVAAIFRCVDGVPPGERNLVVMSKSGGIRTVSALDSSLDPLAYTLLFPHGDPGWHINISHTVTNNQRNKTTMRQYAAYRLSIRETFSLLHRSQKLYLQWVVDMYVRIEGTRLNFIRHNQSNLRADMYLNVADYIHQRAAENNLRVGRQVILPSSFIGSPLYMHQNYLDAMSIVQRFGKPSLFLTMTCNPRWPEISENLAPRESSHYRPDIVVRVFHCKLKELLACIVKKQVFGKIAALIYTIEFRKRGLPHAHMLLTLDDHDKIRSVADIDKFVSAEIPGKNTHHKLYEKVGNYMTHGPCGVLNPHSVCMEKGKCKKKTFQKTLMKQQMIMSMGMHFTSGEMIVELLRYEATL
nr:uncharacterized protein LOC122270722 [Parasteatoda tepidariorum]